MPPSGMTRLSRLLTNLIGSSRRASLPSVGMGVINLTHPATLSPRHTYQPGTHLHHTRSLVPTALSMTVSGRFLVPFPQRRCRCRCQEVRCRCRPLRDGRRSHFPYHPLPLRPSVLSRRLTSTGARGTLSNSSCPLPRRYRYWMRSVPRTPLVRSRCLRRSAMALPRVLVLVLGSYRLYPSLVQHRSRRSQLSSRVARRPSTPTLRRQRR